MDDKEFLGTAPVGDDSTSGSALTSMTEIDGANGTYEIFSIGGTALVTTESWKLYVAKLPSGQMGLMKIAATVDLNHILETESRILRTLQQIATDLDAEAVGRGENPLNYGALFPTLLDSFVGEDGRFVMVLGYHPSINTYKQLFPLARVLDGQRIDLKTGTWVLGKLLKLLDFVHSLGFTVGMVDATNVLIEKDVHGVFVLDFSEANEDASKSECMAEVSAAAKMLWNAVGGGDNNPPHDAALLSAEHHTQYIDSLRRIMDGSTDGAGAEHSIIYAQADIFWPKKPIEGTDRFKRDFHQFVTYSL